MERGGREGRGGEERGREEGRTTNRSSFYFFLTLITTTIIKREIDERYSGYIKVNIIFSDNKTE